MAGKVGRPKGGAKTGGRQAGTPNKVNAEFRETVRKLLEDNAENFAVWLAQVAAEDPDKALQRLTQLAEFAAPKLARTEHVGDEGGPVKIQTIERVIVKPHEAANPNG